MEQIDQWTKCPCCTTTYCKDGERAPHLLLCGHSICGKDVKTLNESGRNIIPCPICKRKIGLYLYKDQFPPRNVSIIEQLDSIRGMYKESTNCQECQLKVCTVYCKDCKIDLCDDCNSSIHKLRVFQTHARVSVAEKASVPQTQMFCSVHEQEPLRLFCLEEQCQKPTCFLCATHGLHKGHNLSLITDAAPSQKEIMTNNSLALCVSTRKGLQEIVNKLYNAEKVLQTNRENFLKSIQDDFQIVRDAINLLESQTYDYVNNEISEVSKDISSLQIEIASRLAEISATEFKSKLALQMDSIYFLSMVKELTDNLNGKNQKLNECLSRAVIPSVDVNYKKDNTLAVPGGGKPREIGLIATTFMSTLQQFHISSIKVNATAELIVSDFVELDFKPAYEFSAIIVKKGGILTVKGWNGTEGTGVLNLMVSGSVVVEEGGQINLTGRGYRGGASNNINEKMSSDGESSKALGGKGGKASNRFGSTGGGGGGLGSQGFDAEPNRYKDEITPGGAGGKKLLLSLNNESTTPNNGEKPTNVLLLGSGGGGGSGYSGSIGGHGGPGGGILMIKAREIRNHGVICSDGYAGFNGEGIYSSGGGGGSGGSIQLTTNILHNFGEISALGGAGGKAGPFNGCFGICSNGGAGGEGMIVIELSDDLTGDDKILPKPTIRWG
jgi:hypothetical protein